MIALYLQFSTDRYVRWANWLAVAWSRGTKAARLLQVGLGDPYTPRLPTPRSRVVFRAWYTSGGDGSNHPSARQPGKSKGAVLATLRSGTTAGDLTAVTRVELLLGCLSRRDASQRSLRALRDELDPGLWFARRSLDRSAFASSIGWRFTTHWCSRVGQRPGQLRPGGRRRLLADLISPARTLPKRFASHRLPPTRKDTPVSHGGLGPRNETRNWHQRKRSELRAFAIRCSPVRRLPCAYRISRRCPRRHRPTRSRSGQHPRCPPLGRSFPPSERTSRCTDTSGRLRGSSKS